MVFIETLLSNKFNTIPMIGLFSKILNDYKWLV